METVFKKNWDHAEFMAVEEAILNHFRGNIETLPGNHIVKSFKQLDNVLGLAYTSSGRYAIYRICNTAVWLDLEHKFKYEMFCVSEDGRIFAELWDNEENELYIQIGKM